jgi:hypothetical protein
LQGTQIPAGLSASTPALTVVASAEVHLPLDERFMSTDPIAVQAEKIARGRAMFTAALDSTNAALQRRMSNHRILIVAGCAVTAGIAVWCGVTGSFAPASCLLGLFSLVAFAIWNDTRIVNGWRRGVLSAWLNERLNLEDLIRAVKARKVLPPRTISGMFKSLQELSRPGPTPLAVEVRSALSQTVVLAHACEATQTLASAVRWAILTVSVSVALTMHFWWALAGVGALLLVTLIERFYERLLVHHAREHLIQVLSDASAFHNFVAIAQSMEWEPIDGSRTRALLNSLTPNQRQLMQANPVSLPK